MNKHGPSSTSEDGSRPSFSWHTRPGPASVKYARIEREAARQRHTPGGRVMHNRKLLIKISQYLPTESIKSLRETSKLWNAEFIPQLREKHAPIDLTGQREWDNGDGDPPGSTTLQARVNELVFLIQLKYSNPNRQLPFTRYRLSARAPGQFLILNQIISEFGPSMKRVELVWERFAEISTAQLRRLVFEELPQLEELVLNSDLDCSNNFGNDNEPEDQPLKELAPGSSLSLVRVIPNLKRISVTKRSCDPAHGSIFTNFIADIMQWAPNLESVKVKEGMTDDQLSFPLRLLIDLRDSVPDLGKLKTLNLHKVSTAELQILVHLGQRKRQQDTNALCLQKCSLNLQCSCSFKYKSKKAGVSLLAETIPLLQSFLVTQAHTLRKLAIKFKVARDCGSGTPPPKATLQIPSMPQLRVLKLFRKAGTPVNFHYEGGSLEHAFPRLRRVA